MPFIKRTTKGKQKHYHLIYLKDMQEGYGIITNRIGKGPDHTHEIVLNYEAEGQMQDVTPYNMNWRILEENNHIHEVEDIPQKEKEVKEDDKRLVSKVYNLYKEAKNKEIDSIDEAEKADKAYKGEQWDEDIKAKLTSPQTKRAALTINKIEPKIDILSGYQRQNRFDIKYLPIENGDSIIADILNIVAKNICDQNNFEFEETETFEDESITGRGLLHFFIDYNEDIEGSIKIENFYWKDVFFGPHRKKDLRDCEYIIKKKWYSKAKVSEMWPEKANEIIEEFKMAKDSFELETHDSKPGGAYIDSKESEDFIDFDSDFIDIKKQNIKILECWLKNYKKTIILVNADDDYFYNAEYLNDSEIKALKELNIFNAIKRVKTRMKKIVVASNVLLEDSFPEYAPEFPITEFPIIPVYAKKRNMTFWGKVKPLIDLQKEINKRTSQTADIINRVSNYGYTYDDDTFSSPQEKEKFKREVSTPGFFLKVKNQDRPPRKEEGTKFPAELVNFVAIRDQEMRELSNVNLDMVGMTSRADSGIAIMERKQQGLIGNEFLFDNLKLAKKILAKNLVKMIQAIYTPERIMRIVNNKNTPETPVEIGGKPLDQYDKQYIYDLLENADLTKYDVSISESAYSPTTKRANFILWSQMAQNGIQIPSDLLIDLSDLPEKEKVKERFAQEQQRLEKINSQKYETEIIKTQMNNQNKGP